MRGRCGAGQVRIVSSGGNTLIRGNVDNDLAAEFEIQVDGLDPAVTPLMAGDFLL